MLHGDKQGLNHLSGSRNTAVHAAVLRLNGPFFTGCSRRTKAQLTLVGVCTVQKLHSFTPDERHWQDLCGDRTQAVMPA